MNSKEGCEVETLLRVRDDELDYDENLVYRYKGELFTGIGYDEDPVHGLCEISYKDGLQDGTSREWSPAGQLKAETEYRKNSQHGADREFYDNGTVKAVNVYEFGILVSRQTFSESGEAVESYEISPSDPGFQSLLRHREGK